MALESLEDRRLLSADGFGWQNHLVPADVNHDGVISAIDALLIVSDLRQNGSRYVGSVQQPAARSDAPGESAAATKPWFPDVNGDNFVTPLDALLVVRHLRNGAEPGDVMEFDLQTTALDGTPLGGPILVGDSFRLNVYVQDVRAAGDPDVRGVYQAFVDVTYDSSLVTVVGGLTHGSDYDDFGISGNLGTPGLIDEAGGANLDTLPLGAGKLLLFSATFTATAAGTVTFAAKAAEVVGHEVLMFDPPSEVPESVISFLSTNLTVLPTAVAAFDDAFTVDRDSVANLLDVLGNDQINSGGTPTIVVDTTGLLGTLQQTGNELRYTPPGGFLGTDTFSYTLSDGLGNSDQATVVITVSPVNRAPVAVDDSGAGFTTKENAVLTTASVLANDMDADGDVLSVLSVNTSGTIGLVTNNGDGTFTYDPNGQFDFLEIGQQAADTFSYTVTDGRGGTSTATVTITIVGAPDQPGQVAGVVYADVNHNGRRDAGERVIGGVQLQLTGTDATGAPVALSTVTDAQGHYSFGDLTPGNYVLRELQPRFFIDGIDAVNGVPYANTNDTIAIPSNLDLTDLRVDFGERGLQPAYIHISDVLNTASRQGIVVGFDANGRCLWYSLLDGWDGVTGVDVRLSNDGASVIVTAWKGAAGMTFGVPLSSTQGKSILKGSTNEGRVYQFLGTWNDYAPYATPTTAAVNAAFAQLG